MNKLNLNECAKLRLDETYIVVYAIRNEVNIKKGDYIEKAIIYTFIGVDKRGYRQFINIYQDRPANNRYWLECFETLKARGVKDILFLSVDDNKNLKRTAKIAFPNIIFFDSITDTMEKFKKYTSHKDYRKLIGDLHKLYTQKTLSDFEDKFKFFKSNYNNTIHQKLIAKYLNNICSIYKYSQNIRNVIYSYSANLALYDKIRLVFDYRTNYINNIEEIFDNLNSNGVYYGFTSYRKKEWTLLLNDVIEVYKDKDFI